MGADAGTQRLARLAARQHRLFTRRQALDCGVGRRVLERLVATGLAHRVHASVYVLGPPVLSAEARWLAATLALGPGAVLSHRAAGALWGILPAAATPLEVTVATGRAPRDGITVHRARAGAPECVERCGIPVTTLPRTVLDLAAVLDATRLARAFEEAQVHHRLRPAALAAELAAGRRRHGAQRVRALLAGAVDPGQVESILELRFLRLCAAHDLPRPATQVRIGRWRVDFWFPTGRLAVETDGARFHATAAKRERDAVKDAALEALGVAVMRVTWAQIAERPAIVAARVRAHLDRPATVPSAAGPSR